MWWLSITLRVLEEMAGLRELGHKQTKVGIDYMAQRSQIKQFYNVISSLLLSISVGGLVQIVGG